MNPNPRVMGLHLENPFRGTNLLELVQEGVGGSRPQNVNAVAATAAAVVCRYHLRPKVK